MKLLQNLFIISGLSVIITSCDKSESPVTINNSCPTKVFESCCKVDSEDQYYSESKYGDFTNSEYTKWMSFPQLQKFMDDFDHSNNWIYRSEGRNFKGLSQYRYAVRKKPDDVAKYWVRGGRNADDFKSLGIKYIRDGFELVSLQLFKDSSGTTRHQAVWFKYKNNSEKPDAAPKP